MKLGIANSRMKDLFDVVIMSRTFSFDGDELVRAIRATFERRGTALPDVLPVALTDEFAADATKLVQWPGFVRKAGASTELRDFGEVVRDEADPRRAARPRAYSGAVGGSVGIVRPVGGRMMTPHSAWLIAVGCDRGAVWITCVWITCAREHDQRSGRRLHGHVTARAATNSRLAPGSVSRSPAYFAATLSRGTISAPARAGARCLPLPLRLERVGQGHRVPPHHRGERCLDP